MKNKFKTFIIFSFIATLLVNIFLPAASLVAVASTDDSVYTLEESELNDIDQLLQKYEVLRMEPNVLEKYEQRLPISSSGVSLQESDEVTTNGVIKTYLVKKALKVAGAVIEALLVQGISSAISNLGNSPNGGIENRSDRITVRTKSMGSVTFNPDSSSVWVWRGRPGMDSYYVRLAQRSLGQAGYYSGSIDGSFGPLSETATMNFQRRRNLQADGRVGPATWRKIAHN